MSYPPLVYDGEHGEVSAVFRPNDAPADLHNPNGNAVDYLASSRATDGRFGLYRWNFGPAASGPDPHFHRTITESFFVLSGVVRLFDGTTWRDAGPGDFLYVPEGGVHGFRNESGAAASMLLLFTPGAPRETYFETLTRLAEGGTMTPDEREAFFLGHDNHWV